MVWCWQSKVQTKQIWSFCGNNYRGLQLFHLFHQHHPYHNHKLPHHHPLYLSTGECVIWLAVLPCPPQYPSHVLLLRTARTILIFLTSLSLTSWLVPHFLWHKLYPNSIPHNVLQNILLLRTVRSILIFLTSLSLTSWLAPHFYGIICTPKVSLIM